MKLFKKFIVNAGLVSCLAFAAQAQQQDQVNGDAITGTVSIQFNSRTDVNGDGSPKRGATDVYTFTNFKIHGASVNVILNGTITRTPYVKKGKMSWGADQKPQLVYDLSVGFEQVKTGNKKEQVGKLVGIVPLDPQEKIDGGLKYDLTYNFSATGNMTADQSASLLKIRTNAVGTQPEIVDFFTGSMIGKRKSGKEEKKDQKKIDDGFSIKKLKVWQKGKQVEIPVKQVDPLKFLQVGLAKGPLASYSGATVTGDLNYEYETGNWITQGITFAYNGATPDVLTGGIQWIESTEDNKPSHYDLSLRFNEQAYYNSKGGAAAADVFAADASSADASDPFAVDTGLPALTGAVEYQDTLGAGVGDDRPVISSLVTYKVKANKLSSKQVMNFAKLWLLLVGPMNDD